MSLKNRFKEKCIIVFGRYPEPGKTKTRLIPNLGPAGAADLHRRLVERVLKTAIGFLQDQTVCLQFCYDGGDEAKVRRWLTPDMMPCKQASGDIGLRMHEAFRQAFDKGAKQVVLVGTDIPEITAGHFKDAFESLKEHDLVLGPSIDGGYWLMGLKRWHDVFQGIDWGTEKVFEQTMDQAKHLGLRVRRLNPLEDIDTIVNLRKIMPEEAEPGPFVSVIIPALNEERHIEYTIQCALDQDTEVIVVDGGSGDHTVEISRAAGAAVFTSKAGRAFQQNYGAVKSHGRVLLFLHADTLLPERFVSHIFNILMDPETLLGAFQFKTDIDRPLMKLFERLTNFRSTYLNLPYGDQALFLRKSRFIAAGGFPLVPIAEDLLFVRRLSKLGRIRIAPAKIVTSGRRWQAMGMFQTIIINQIIVAGCLLGVSPHVLAPLYRIPRRVQGVKVSRGQGFE